MAGIIIRARATHRASERESGSLCAGARTHNSSVFKTASYFPQTPASRQTLIRLSRPQSQFAPLEIKLFWRRRLCFRFVCSCSRASISPANYNFLCSLLSLNAVKWKVLCAHHRLSACGLSFTHTLLVLRERKIVY